MYRELLSNFEKSANELSQEELETLAHTTIYELFALLKQAEEDDMSKIASSSSPDVYDTVAYYAPLLADLEKEAAMGGLNFNVGALPRQLATAGRQMVGGVAQAVKPMVNRLSAMRAPTAVTPTSSAPAFAWSPKPEVATAAKEFRVQRQQALDAGTLGERAPRMTVAERRAQAPAAPVQAAPVQAAPVQAAPAQAAPVQAAPAQAAPVQAAPQGSGLGLPAGNPAVAQAGAAAGTTRTRPVKSPQPAAPNMLQDANSAYAWARANPGKAAVMGLGGLYATKKLTEDNRR